MNKFTRFLQNTLANIFGDQANVPPPKTYNQEQVKAGIIHLRNTLMNGDPRENMKTDYDDVFRTIRLRPKMNVEQIHEQTGLLMDKMIEEGLITPEEQRRTDHNMLHDSMTGTVLNAIEGKSLEENLLNAIRFDQDLRHPHLKVIHRTADNE